MAVVVLEGGDGDSRSGGGGGGGGGGDTGDGGGGAALTRSTHEFSVAKGTCRRSRLVAIHTHLGVVVMVVGAGVV